MIQNLLLTLFPLNLNEIRGKAKHKQFYVISHNESQNKVSPSFNFELFDSLLCSHAEENKAIQTISAKNRIVSI